MGVYGGPTRQYYLIITNPGFVTDNLKVMIDGAKFVTDKNLLPDVVASRILGQPLGGAGTDAANNAVTLAGGSQRYNFGADYTDIDLVDRTIQAWVYPKKLNSLQAIIDKDFDSGGGVYGGWGFWLSSSNTIQYWPAGGHDKTGTGYAITGNTWSHLSVTHNVSTNVMTQHVNGVFRNTFTDVNAIPYSSGTANLQIGAYRSGSNGPLTGSIALVMIYDRVLSNTEIAQNYNAFKSRFGL